MIRVLFICHGNICRSPMAEFIFRDMVQKAGLADRFLIASAATSTEEIWGDVGNPVHHGTKAVLDRLGISCEGKRAVQVTKADYGKYDYLICMDRNNIRNTIRITGPDVQKKLHLLLDYTDHPRDVADPWYTGNFEATYRDVVDGCTGLLKFLEKSHTMV